MTPAGLKKLKDEAGQLFSVERPRLVETVAWAASNGDRSENADYIYGKRRLREIDSRLRFLTKKIEAAEVVDPTLISSQSVVFGATVTLQKEAGGTQTVCIVGEDEAEAGRGHISWKSPLARMLLGKKVGDEFEFHKPNGSEFLVVERIEYKAIEPAGKGSIAG